MSSRPTQVAEPAGKTPKHRCRTQMLPAGSGFTPMTSPHLPPFMLVGSCAQFSTRRYGLGWAWAATADAATIATTATRVGPTRPASTIAASPEKRKTSHRKIVGAAKVPLGTLIVNQNSQFQPYLSFRETL